MCGRLNVVDDPLSRFVSEQLGLDFRVTTNRGFAANPGRAGGLGGWRWSAAVHHPLGYSTELGETSVD